MSRRSAAILVIEVAATIAVQASGLGGVYVAVAAVVVVLTAATFLFLSSRRTTLAQRLQAFAAERRASAPLDGDDKGRAEHELDTMECFNRRHGPEVKATTQRLYERGAIGGREQRRLNNPTNLEMIEQLADRLAELDALPRR
jgi:hypothetical protein